jgi:hypothetical protein
LTSTDSHRPGITDFVHIGLVVEGMIVELAERLDGEPA